MNRQPLSGRQRLLVDRMLEDDFEGRMHTSKFAKLAKCSADAALRDIQGPRAGGFFTGTPAADGVRVIVWRTGSPSGSS